ncbi:Shedu immune nuclease family protein [Abditibacterium utsteinense]|nr:Shedu immune nuclease family protein [Abditibacterium utsteinense]
MQEISGSHLVYPTTEQIRRYIFGHLKANVTLGYIYLALMNAREYSQVDYDDFKCEVDLDEIALASHEESLPRTGLIELSGSPLMTNGEKIGIVITKEKENEEECFYEVTILSDINFPHYTLGFSSLKVSKREKYVSTVNAEGNWVREDISDKIQDYILALDYRFLYPLLALNFFLKENKPSLLRLDQIETDGTRIHSNEKLEKMIKLAYEDKIPLVKMKVDLNKVKPFNFDHCLNYPLENLENLSEEARRGRLHDVLTYYEDGKFIMDDDYAYYLSYKIADLKEINVVNLGLPPNGSGKVIKIGRSELMPPIGVKRKSNFSLPEELNKKLLLETKINALKREPQKGTELISTFLHLSRLIQNTSLSEKVLHKFLMKNPIVIDAYGQCFKSEVSLMKETRKSPKFRVDIIVQYSGVEKQVSLIELERANIPIFTEHGDLRREVNHALRQVEDWLMWWRENPALVPKPFDCRLPVEGLVVIGRSIDLTDEEKRRLLHRNSHSKIKILTYDDLLDRIEELIHKFQS